MLSVIYGWSQKSGYWLLASIWLFMMEAVALSYQYVIGTEPCALCVQIRAWVAGALIITLLLTLIKSNFWPRLLGLLAVGGLLGGALNTSWQAWNVEKGNVFSTCGMDAGFPEWLKLNQWLPQVFEAKGLCGQSPELIMGITMTDALLVSLAIPLLLLSLQILTHIWNLLFGSKA